MRQAFGEAASIHEDKRGAMLLYEDGNALVDFVPHFVGGDGAELAGWNFDGEIETAALLDLHDYGRGAFAAGEKLADEFDGFLRGGEADAGERLRGERFQTFQRKGEVRAALVVCDGVNFVHNQRANCAQQFPALSGGEKDVERFRSGDQNVRWALLHGEAIADQRVAGADGGADFGHQIAALMGELENFSQRDV